MHEQSVEHQASMFNMFLVYIWHNVVYVMFVHVAMVHVAMEIIPQFEEKCIFLAFHKKEQGGSERLRKGWAERPEEGQKAGFGKTKETLAYWLHSSSLFFG